MPCRPIIDVHEGIIHSGTVPRINPMNPLGLENGLDCAVGERSPCEALLQLAIDYRLLMHSIERRLQQILSGVCFSPV